ncbi:MAG: hypothetical protein ACQEXJ_11930 [Myxococcota bacterium]
MYTVSVGERIHDEFEQRSDAIDAAKEISEEKRGKINIEDDTGREWMVYRNGELEYYVFETRSRQRRKN